MRIVAVGVVAVVALIAAAASPAFSRPERACQIAGDVPEILREPLCSFASAVSASGPPSHVLAVGLSDQDLATSIRIRLQSTEDFLLTLLDAYLTRRGIDVATIMVFHGPDHLATVKTNGRRAATVT